MIRIIIISAELQFHILISINTDKYRFIQNSVYLNELKIIAKQAFRTTIQKWEK